MEKNMERICLTESPCCTVGLKYNAINQLYFNNNFFQNVKLRDALMQLYILQTAKSDSEELSDSACVFLVSRRKSGTTTLISQSIDLGTNIPY